MQQKATTTRPHKKAVVPYEPLIAFANERITQDNWRAVLNRLSGRPIPPHTPEQQDQALRDWITTYRRLGFLAPVDFEGKKIAGPEPLQLVQNAFREDLTRLTDPAGWTRSTYVFSTRFDETPRGQDLSWLVQKINGLTLKSERLTTHADGKTPILARTVGEMEIPMQLTPDAEVRRRATGDFRVLVTDRVYFVPAIADLRVWVYFRLASLWADGFLSRIGCCQKCAKFFLAKTERADRKYCSQQCAQGITAAERTKATRVRRGAWESVQKDLEVAVKWQNREILEKALPKAKQAFAAAYPRHKGPGYEEGKALLAQAEKQVRRLRR